MGKRITTYWNVVERLRGQGRAEAVLDDVLSVRDGKIVTSAGVSAGIDMALGLVGHRSFAAVTVAAPVLAQEKVIRA